MSEQTCFSAISSFNDSGLHDWPGSRQKLYINYCEDGYAKLQLKNIEYFLQRIYTGTKGYEKLIMDGKVISDKTSDKGNLKRDQNADSTPSNSIKNITLPIKREWNGVGEGMRGTIIVPDLRKWKYPEVPVKLTLGNINCDGSSIAQSGDWSKGETARGVFTLKCSNGRVVTGTYTSPAAGQGIGKGKDDNGFEFLYVYGAGAT